MRFRRRVLRSVHLYQPLGFRHLYPPVACRYAAHTAQHTNTQPSRMRRESVSIQSAYQEQLVHSRNTVNTQLVDSQSANSWCTVEHTVDLQLVDSQETNSGCTPRAHSQHTQWIHTAIHLPAPSTGSFNGHVLFST